jgi:hypothetical protein
MSFGIAVATQAHVHVEDPLMRAYSSIFLIAMFLGGAPAAAAHPVLATALGPTVATDAGSQLVAPTTLAAPLPLSDQAMAATVGAGWPSWLSDLADVARSVFDSFVDNLEDFLVVAAFLAGIGIGIAIVAA